MCIAVRREQDPSDILFAVKSVWKWRVSAIFRVFRKFEEFPLRLVKGGPVTSPASETGQAGTVLSTQTNRKLFSRGVAETLLVAFFFHGYGAPMFDGMRPEFLDRPLTEYRQAVLTISNGQEIGLEQPLLDALGPIKQIVRDALSPA